MPEVSVIIPSFNHAAYIIEAVRSVLDQTFSDLELIVVDDGSTDDTLEMLNRIKDERIRVLSQENQGAHAAINRGLREADGEYLAILNSDDAYCPERLAKMLSVLKTNPTIGLAGSFIEIIDRQGVSLGVKHGYQDCPPWLLEVPERSFRAGDNLPDALLTENYLSTTSNFVFTRKLYRQVGEFLPLRYTHDWDFALRAVSLAGTILVPEPLVRYRVHASNTIRENQAAMIFEICWILAVHLPQNALVNVQPAPVFFSGRVDQLLHSIYVFGMDRVLIVMLIQRLDEHPDLALELLKPGDPTRAKYIEFIEQQLARIHEGRNPQHNNPDTEFVTSGGQGAHLKNLASRLKGVWMNLKSRVS